MVLFESCSLKGEARRFSANFARPSSCESFSATFLFFDWQFGNQLEWWRYSLRVCDFVKDGTANAGKTVCKIFKCAGHSSRLFLLKNEIWHRFRIFSSRLGQFLYNVKEKPQLELCATLEIRILITYYCTSCRRIFKGLSQDVGRTDFSENLRASLFNDVLPLNVLSARSVSLDSAFKHYTINYRYEDAVNAHSKWE